MTEALTVLYEGCRSYRRFKQISISKEILRELAETARKRSSGMNAQPLRYVLAGSPDAVQKIQPCLYWAAKLPKEIGTPKEDELPVAFIVVLGPENENSFVDIDLGIALDTMAITAWQKGIGSCILGNIQHRKLAEIVSAPEGYKVYAVLALGYPANTSTIVSPDEEHGLNYYVDEERNYYVPKRPADEVIRYL